MSMEMLRDMYDGWWIWMVWWRWWPNWWYRELILRSSFPWILKRNVRISERTDNLINLYCFSPSKSTVPEPSESISSIMPFRSWSVSWSSSSRRISFRHDVGMKPLPSLSYRRKASFSSFCMASASSSTMNLAANCTNSENSSRPDSVWKRRKIYSLSLGEYYMVWLLYVLSSSTSSINSSRIFLSKGCPINRRISATMSHGILPDFWLSKLLKAFCSTVDDKNLYRFC